jgi:hypothetical protein
MADSGCIPLEEPRTTHGACKLTAKTGERKETFLHNREAKKQTRAECARCEIRAGKHRSLRFRCTADP